ncbi:hypothetical protein PAHAL_9G328600 [Panicum hallii]|uniref:Uncharacterized protein n=1 Tax=Panicum hallii TaxID=206008 RepID=A0A2T8I378_9POAL|nr:hypothetical protein PAHAL_9G328600 [Panicum hallii]
MGGRHRTLILFKGVSSFLIIPFLCIILSADCSFSGWFRTQIMTLWSNKMWRRR